jgi:hypothetical protein
MPKRPLTILIGSFARGTADTYSDIDIIRVGHQRPLTKTELGPLTNSRAPISYIDYDEKTFASLHKAGSLFLHHTFTEGRLLAGDPSYWARLVRGFSVTKNLQSEINEQLGLCKWLARPEAFSHATMPMLSHMFRALKNAAIFMLAERELYVYDKRRALRNAFKFLSAQDIELLVAANCVYERDRPPLAFLTTAESTKALQDLCARVRAVAGDMLRNGN